MAERREIAEYVSGDLAKLQIRLRHKRNIASMRATFAHAERSALTVQTEGSVTPVSREGVVRNSVATFEDLHIGLGTVPGQYQCVTLHVRYHGDNNWTMLDVPEGLCFRVIEAPRDPPEIQSWNWDSSGDESEESS